VTATVKTTFRLLYPHARKHLGNFALLFALGAIAAFGQRSMVLFVYPAMEIMFPDAASGAPATAPTPGGNAVVGFGRELARRVQAWLVGGVATGEDKLAALGRIAIVLACVALLASTAQYIFLLIARRIALHTVVDLRMRIARHLMGLSMAYHGRRHFGDLLSRLSSDATTSLNVLNMALKDLVQEPLLGGAALVFAACIAPLPTLFVVLGLVVVAVPLAKQARKVRKGSTKSLTSLGSSVQALSQMFQGIRAVKAFRAEERELEGYGEINAAYVRATMKMLRAQALSQAMTMFLSHLGMAVLVVVVGWLTLSRGAFHDEKDLAAFFLYVAGMYMSLRVATKAIMVMQESVGASERIQALLDEKSDVVERPHAKTISGLGSGLRFEKVSFAYPGGDGNAVIDLDLSIRPGETIALVGPSGAGKSTVVDLVARFIDPVQGRITVDGLDLRDLTLDSWIGRYAMVGQTPFLFHTSIEENIRYGKADATQAEIEEASRAAGIHEFIADLPEGYRTNVADAGSRLSGGQRQRITIARAFLKGAPLLLLDEATSALDTESEQIVQEALDRLMSHRTVIVIAHRLSTIRNADRIAVLDEGRLVEIGTHQELLARNGPYARLHAMQFREEIPARA